MAPRPTMNRSLRPVTQNIRKVTRTSKKNSQAAKQRQQISRGSPSERRQQQLKKMKARLSNKQNCVECSVCYCDSASHRMRLKCGHAFHRDCIRGWLESHGTCPLCRSVEQAIPSKRELFMRRYPVDKGQYRWLKPTYQRWLFEKELTQIMHVVCTAAYIDGQLDAPPELLDE